MPTNHLILSPPSPLVLSLSQHSFTSKEQACFKFVSAVTDHSNFEAQENMSLTVSTFSPSICHEVMGPLEKSICSQEATVRTGQGTTDWFQIRKGVRQGCILSPCLVNLYAEYIIRNVGLDEAQAGIKFAGRNINNLKDADHTTLMAEREELKSFLMKVKEGSEEVGLKLNIQKTEIMACSRITSWQIDEETLETVTEFYLGGLQNHCRW